MPAKPPEIADLLILGDDAAAAGAAIHAGRLGLSVILVSPPHSSDPSELVWLSPPGLKLCTELGVRPAKCGAGVWTGVTLVSGDFQKQITLKQPTLSGWVVPNTRLRDELIRAAVAGGTRKSCGTLREIRSVNDLFCVELDDGETIRGRIGLLSDESAIGLSARSGALQHIRPRAAVSFAALDTPPLGKTNALHIIPPAQRDGPMAVWCSDAMRGRLCVYVRNGRGDPNAELARILTAARAAGLLPAQSKVAVINGSLPAGDALEIDSHVGKRALLIGAVGGFVAAASNETLYTAIRSGLLAVEAAQRALKSSVIQDELVSFDAHWRRELADFIRPMHTDLSLLHPLLFNNEQMAIRLAKALLLGQPF